MKRFFSCLLFSLFSFLFLVFTSCQIGSQENLEKEEASSITQPGDEDQQSSEITKSEPVEEDSEEKENQNGGEEKSDKESSSITQIQNGTYYYNYNEELLYLDSLELSAVAYPGVNQVSWKPVTGACSYVVYKYEESQPVESFSFKYDDALIFFDTEIKDGLNYTYIVEAESKSSPSRSVSVQNTMKEISLRAIVPPFWTKTLDLSGYEEVYSAEQNDSTLDAYILDEENIELQWVNGLASISFPVKAYLNYSVYLKKKSPENLISENEMVFVGKYSSLVNNKIINVNKKISESGTYSVFISTEALNSAYQTLTSVESVAEISIPCNSLEQGSANVEVNYINDGNAVCVSWTPAILENGDFVNPENYSVFVVNNSTGEYEEITSINSDGENYSAIISLENNTEELTYLLKLTIDDESEEENLVALDPYVILEEGNPVEFSEPVFEVIETQGSVIANAKFTVSLLEGQKIESIKYGMVDLYVTKDNLKDSDFTNVIDFTADDFSKIPKNISYKFAVENLEVNKKLAIFVEVSQSGKYNSKNYYLSDSVEYKLPEYISRITVNGKYLNCEFIEYVSDESLLSNVTYKISYAYSETKDYTLAPDAKWVEVLDGIPEYKKNGNTYEGVIKSLLESHGYYIVKLQRFSTVFPEMEPYEDYIFLRY